MSFADPEWKGEEENSVAEESRLLRAMIRPERSWLRDGAISTDLLDKAAGVETFGAAHLAFVADDELLWGRAG